MAKKDYYAEHYSQLTGAIITRFVGMDENEFGRPYPVLRARLTSGKWVLLSISSDPEENEGGHIHIYPEETTNDATS